jgi:spore germination protein YaaH
MAAPTDPRWTSLKAGLRKAAEATTVGLDDCILETYVVQKGDTPAGVAQRFGFTVHELKAANPTTPSFEAFPVGLRIFIPSNRPGVCAASTPTGQPQDTTPTPG